MRVVITVCDSAAAEILQLSTRVRSDVGQRIGEVVDPNIIERSGREQAL